MELVAVLALRTTWWWCTAVLADEDRYLRAVAPLAHSPRFARLAGVSVSVAVRQRGGWRRPVARQAGRAMAVVTRHTMGRRHFDRLWTVGHRTLHRHRIGGFRIAFVMVALATMGLAVGITTKLDPRV